MLISGLLRVCPHSSLHILRAYQQAAQYTFNASTRRASSTNTVFLTPVSPSLKSVFPPLTSSSLERARNGSSTRSPTTGSQLRSRRPRRTPTTSSFAKSWSAQRARERMARKDLDQDMLSMTLSTRLRRVQERGKRLRDCASKRVKLTAVMS